MRSLMLKNSFTSNLIDDFFGDSFFNNEWIFNPIKEKNNQVWYSKDEKSGEYSIVIQASGFSKEDIEIEVDEAGIKISGELKNENLKEKIGEKKFSYYIERNDINYKDVNASLENGILEIKFKPKKEEKIVKKIDIK